MNRKSSSKNGRDRNPTIEAFRALVVLANTGSVTETARRLKVSQPVISKKLQIFKDAQACGMPLLRPARSSGRVELTNAGRAVVPAIEQLLDRYDLIVNYLHGKESAPRLLRIGTGSFAAEHYLPEAIVKLRPMLEDCQIETHVCRGRDRIVGTASGRFDISIVTHNKSQIRQTLRDERLSESLLTVERLGRHPMCVVALRDSDAGRELLAMPETDVVPLKQFENWELIVPDRQSGLRRQFEQRLLDQSLYVSIVSEGGGWSAAMAFARKGIGAAIVPYACVTAKDQESLVARQMAKEFDVTDYLLYRNHDSSEYVAEARKAIARAIRIRGR
jgi:DNA-binding transcriptional LysR family regulator